MKANFKFKKFVSFLSQIDEFESPKIELEQYCTPVDITAGLFEILEINDSAISGKVFGDFCCGTAMYSIAASYFEPSKIVSVDIDTDALEIARANIEHYELTEQIQVFQGDLIESLFEPKKGESIEKPEKISDLYEYFDTIIMNPPFGTKNNEGVDMKLLNCCVNALKPGGTLYSLHKESTSKFITKYVEQNHPNCKIELLSKIEFDLPNTYKFHKKKNAVTEVVLIKVTKNE